MPDGRRLWIGWLSNWLYANEEPTSGWRGVQSFPRVLSLRNGHLVQEPVAELKALRGAVLQLHDATVDEANRALAAFHSQSYEVEVDGAAAVHVLKGDGEETIVSVDGMVAIDRRHSGNVEFTKEFAKVHKAVAARTRKLRIFVDHSVVDVFANDGETVLTDRVFPSANADGLAVSGGPADRVTLTVWKMK